MESLKRYMLEEKRNFQGWDFSYLINNGRMKEFPLTWNYYNILERYCRDGISLLDMGTGGGEFLSRLPFLPIDTSATESYVPNIEIAKGKLEPLGVKVYRITDDDNLPFEEKRFNLVVNRHESYSSSEVNRILKEGGLFITQQVGSLNDKELNYYFKPNKKALKEWNLSIASKDLINLGFEVIEVAEDKVKTRFYDTYRCYYILLESNTLAIS